MDKTKLLIVLTVILLVGIAGCENNTPPATTGGSTGGSASTGGTDTPTVKSTKEERNVQLPSDRSFYMGFTNYPYDITPKAIAETFDFVNEHEDIIQYQINEGVPWAEALENKPYHPNVYKKMDEELEHAAENKLYIAAQPLSNNRDAIAPSWSFLGKQPLPKGWENKRLNDPDVIKAYLNFCRYLLDTYNPDYFSYGVESNMLEFMNPDPAIFDDYMDLNKEVYETLKAEYPDTPIFLTLQLELYESGGATFQEAKIESQREVVRRLMQYSDYIAISSYPYGFYNDPKTLPDDYFEVFNEFGPGKPIVITETGFIAEDLVKRESTVPGNPELQADYVSFLLEQAQRLDMEFVVWFTIRDYDKIWEEYLRLGNTDEGFKNWRDTGLLDEDGNKRPGYDIWMEWLE